MKVSNKVNAIRRSLMRKLTSSIGKSNLSGFKVSEYNDKVIRILIVRPNHRLGNLILITPLIKEIESIFPNPSIDLFVKGNLSEIIFKNYNSINKHIKLPKKPFDNLFNYFGVWIKLLFNKYDLIHCCPIKKFGALIFLYISGLNEVLTRFSLFLIIVTRI